MWQVLLLSPSPERARPYAEVSERKLSEIGIFGTSSKSREDIEKFQCERLSKQLRYINQSFFQNSYSKLRNWLPCFYFDNFQSS